MNYFTLRTLARLFAIDFMKRKSIRVLEDIHTLAVEEQLSLNETLALIRLFEEAVSNQEPV